MYAALETPELPSEKPEGVSSKQWRAMNRASAAGQAQIAAKREAAELKQQEEALEAARVQAKQAAKKAYEDAKQRHKGKKGDKQTTKKPEPLTPLEINMRDKVRFMREAVERGTDLAQFFDCCAHPAWFANGTFEEIEEITRRAYDRAMSRPHKAYTLCDLETLVSRLYDWYYNVDKVRLKDVHMDSSMYRAYVYVLGPNAYRYTSYVNPAWILGEMEQDIREYLRQVIPESALLGPDGKTEVWPREALEDHLLDIVEGNSCRPYVTRPIADVLRCAFESIPAAVPAPSVPQEEEYERYYGKENNSSNNNNNKAQNKNADKPKSVFKARFA